MIPMQETDLSVPGRHPIDPPLNMRTVATEVAMLTGHAVSNVIFFGGLPRDILLEKTPADYDVVLGCKNDAVARLEFDKIKRAIGNRLKGGVSFRGKLLADDGKIFHEHGNRHMMRLSTRHYNIDLTFAGEMLTLEQAAEYSNIGLSAISANLREVCLHPDFVKDAGNKTISLRDSIADADKPRTVRKIWQLTEKRYADYAPQPAELFAERPARATYANKDWYEY